MFQGIQVQMVKINEEASMKIYYHILCTSIIQNLMFLHSFAKRKFSAVENHYNVFTLHTQNIISLLKVETL
jgi:hypothetical protein